MREAYLEDLDAVLRRGEGFGHRAHLNLAWLYLRHGDPESAEDQMRSAIQHVASSHGTPDKYHETLTMTWVRLVAAHRRAGDAPDFDTFLSENPGLLDRDLPSRHFSVAVLLSEAARRGLVDPDLAPLP